MKALRSFTFIRKTARICRRYGLVTQPYRYFLRLFLIWRSCFVKVISNLLELKFGHPRRSWINRRFAQCLISQANVLSKLLHVLPSVNYILYCSLCYKYSMQFSVQPPVEIHIFPSVFRSLALKANLGQVFFFFSWSSSFFPETLKRSPGKKYKLILEYYFLTPQKLQQKNKSFFPPKILSTRENKQSASFWGGGWNKVKKVFIKFHFRGFFRVVCPRTYKK